MTTQRKLLRSATNDRGPPTRDVIAQDGFAIVETIGPNMRKLPNGNLLCLNVPVARTGWMIYGAGEVPVEPGEDGLIYVQRLEDDLFNDLTMGSVAGAAITDEHPEDDVTPENWKELARGFACTNVRRGEGDEAELLLVDLIITDKDLIEEVMSGKRQLSLGYDADYETISPGVGRQTNIIGNHIALVGKGRCGPRCAIGDSDSQLNGKETDMPSENKRVQIKTGDDTRRRVPLSTQISAARRKMRDAEAELEALESGDDPDTKDSDVTDPSGAIHIHVHGGGSGMPKAGGAQDEDPDPNAEVEDPDGTKTTDDPYEERFAALEAGHAAIMDQMKSIADAVSKLTGGTGDADPDDEKKTDDEFPDDGGKKKDDTQDADPDDEKKDGKIKTMDSAALETGYKAVIAAAEILVPGFRMPTFDAKLKRAATVDRMCQARRGALTACYATADGAKLIESVTDSKDLDLGKMDCKEVATIFKAASGAKALLNNASQTRDSSGLPKDKKDGVKVGGPSNLIDLNKANAAYWEGQRIKQA
jgi:hypothetical protein